MPDAAHACLAAAICSALIICVLPFATLCICALDLVMRSALRPNFNPAPSADVSSLAAVVRMIRRWAQLEPVPAGADPLLYWAAPLASLFFAMAGFAVIPFGPAFQVADLDTALLFIVAAGACSAYAMVLARFSRRDEILAPAAMQSAAQFAGCAIAAILALLSPLLLAGSLSMNEIVRAQFDQGAWFLVLAPLGFLLYAVASVGAMQSAPFTASVPHGDPLAAITSGFRGFILRATDAANILLAASVATIVFLGGWQRPFARYHDHLLGSSVELLDALPSVLLLLAAAELFRRARDEAHLSARKARTISAAVCVACAMVAAISLAAPPDVIHIVHGTFWFGVKMLACIAGFVRVRIALDGVVAARWTRLAWTFLVPLALVNIVSVGGAIVLRQVWGWSPGSSLLLTTIATMAVAVRLVSPPESDPLDFRSARQVRLAE